MQLPVAALPMAIAALLVGVLVVLLFIWQEVKLLLRL
jgi:hypothetical protein